MATRVRKKNAQLANLLDPEFVSVVKSPSNKTGFKIIRSADEDGDGSKMVTVGGSKKTRVRKKRSDDGLLSIDLPAGVTYEAAEGVMDSFGLADDYDIVQRDDSYSLVRKGSDDSVATMPIDLGEGIVANVRPESFEGTKAQRKDREGVRLVRIDFDKDSFEDEEAVEAYMSENAIDFKEGGMSVTDTGVSVIRHDFDESDSKTVTLAEGVTGVIVRSDNTDVPLAVQRSVVEQAYGNWGWGQLDFAAAMADPEFSNKSWDALYTLRDVLENIIFYSDLKLAERQALIENTCEQYASYMSSLIAALPREVINKARSDENILNQNQENTTMSTKTTPAKKTDTGEEKQLTREDIVAIVGETVAEALPAVADALEAKLAKRSDDADDANKETVATVAESITTMGEVMQTMRSTQEAMQKSLDELAGTTNVARSDDDDADDGDDADDDDDADGKQAKRSDDSPFAGMFNSSLGLNS